MVWFSILEKLPLRVNEAPVTLSVLQPLSVYRIKLLQMLSDLDSMTLINSVLFPGVGEVFTALATDR
jgi:hypothetical protein